MNLTDELLLPPDVMLIDVADLAPALREQIGDAAGYAVTRPRARHPSSLVDDEVARLLKEFRQPTTIVEAVIRYCRAAERDPEQTLTDAYPALRQCLTEGFLVPPGSPEAEAIGATLAAGDCLAGGTVVRSLQVLEDTELYQMTLGNGALAALKLLRGDRREVSAAALRREAAILAHLDGRGAPRLLESGHHDGRPWLLLEWCEGVPLTAAAAARRLRGGQLASGDLLRLLRDVAVAYADLHDAGVIHGDVHPGNVLVGADGSVRLVDFGLARSADGGLDGDDPPRGGVQTFFEPEYALAVRGGYLPPPATVLGEQYSVAALLYEAAIGSPYVDFALEPDELLRQIVEEPPRSFHGRGGASQPDLERLLETALSKERGERLASMRILADRLAALVEDDRPSARHRGHPVLDATVDRFVTHVQAWRETDRAAPARAPTASVTYGAAGVASALLRIASSREDADVLALADEWANLALRRSDRPDAFVHEGLGVTEELVGQVSPYHRLSGLHLVQVGINHAAGDAFARQRAMDAFVAASSPRCDNVDVTLGRAGVVLGCALAVEATAGTPYADTAAIVDLGHATLTSIWQELDGMTEIGPRCALTHLGVAHGWAGVLYATMRWCRAVDGPLPAGLADRLDQLAALALPVGLGVRWPWTAGESASHTMAGWCNGTAGYVFLWVLAHRTLEEQRYLQLAERSAWDTATTISSIPHLCCGLAGQSYALLELFRHSGDVRWLTFARELAERAASSPHNERTMIAGSLYKGDAGVAALAADLAHPEHAAQPVFGHEGW